MEEEKADGSNFMGAMRDALLLPVLIHFLGMNETTNLGKTCRDMNDMVKNEVSRLPFPRFIWQKRLPTVTGYYKSNENVDHVVVSQMQEFSFSILFKNNTKLRVRCLVENDVWEEYENRREGVGVAPLETFPRPTRVRIDMSFPRLATQLHARLFTFHPNEPHRGWRLDLLQRFTATHQDHEWSKQDKTNLRVSMRILYNQDDTAYPTAEYLTRALPEPLYKRFPKAFDWGANHTDRNTVVEVSYFKAGSLEE